MEQSIDIIISNVHPHKYAANQLLSGLRDKITPTEVKGKSGINTDDEEYKWTTLQKLKGRFHGRGCRQFKNGNTIEEWYINGKREGAFTISYANGDKRVSMCQNGKAEGLAQVIRNNGDFIFEQWKNDNLNGVSLILLKGSLIIKLKEWEDGELISAKYFDIRRKE